MTTPHALVLNGALLEYWAKKFFPHLQTHYGILCVVAILATHQKKETT